MAPAQKPHAVCVPFPAQGHINPMLKLAKLLHYKGFHITFVNTEFNHHRLLKSQGPHRLADQPSFRFATIPDGLPPSAAVDATQDIPALCHSTSRHCLQPFRVLLSKLNNSSHVRGPPVSCIVSDGAMAFTVAAAEELGIPKVLFWTPSACGFMSYMHYRHLVEKGFTPLQDVSCLSNGYLDTVIDWIPGMKGVRLRDLPSFIRTTDPDDIMLNFIVRETESTRKASAIILNTFKALEQEVLDALSSMLHPIYSIGPLQFLLNQIPKDELSFIESSLWKDEAGYLKWLDSKEVNSVIYVNFGSIAVMSRNQLIEFAWGLANSNKNFLWTIRPDLINGASAVIPHEFLSETKDRGFIVSWCDQERVLGHASVGGFLTHCGWNSIIESVCCGVPMLCWPFFAEQQTNSRYCCDKWGIGMEIESDAKRGRVERLVRELMEGEKGKEMKKKAMERKRQAEEATKSSTGSSYLNFEKMVNDVLLAE